MPSLKRWTVPVVGLVAVAAVGALLHLAGREILSPVAVQPPPRTSPPPVAREPAPPPADPAPVRRAPPAAGPSAALEPPAPAPESERIVFDHRHLAEVERAFFGIVSEEGGGPVAVGRVEVTPSPRSFDPPEVETSQLTNSEGKFLIRRLKEETYTVRVSGKGLVSAIYYNLRRGKELNVTLRRGVEVSGKIVAEKDGRPLEGATVEGFGQDWKETARADREGLYRILAPRGQPISLTGSADGYEQHREDNVVPGERPAVNFRLKEGVVVVGTVIASETRQPVAGAKVSSGIFHFFNRREHGVTGPDGTFVVRGLPRGGTMFTIKAPGYSEKMENVLYGDVDRKEVVFELFRSATVEGRVTDTGGRPVANAGVFFAEKTPIAFLTLDATPKTYTDAEGAFRLTDVNAGKDAAGRDKEYIFNAEKENFVRGESKPVLVEPGKVTKEVAIVLANGGVLSGKVQDTRGNPVEGADLKVQSLVPPPAGNLLWIAADLRKTKDATTGPAGEFRIGGVRPGRLKLLVSADRYLKREDLEFEVAEGAEIRNIVVTLEKGYTIAGRVTDQNGDPVPKAQVYASGSYPTPSYGNSESGPEGYYRINGLKAGRFTVNIRAAGYSPGLRTEVEADDENVDFVITKNGALSGLVRAAATLEPVERFRVTLYQFGGGPEGGGPSFSKQKYFNTKDGKFHVEDVSAGTYEVVVSADEYAPRTIPAVQVRQGVETEGTDVLLDEGATIEGTVRDRMGGILENAIVYLEKLRPDTGEVDFGAERKTSRVEPTGLYTLKGVGSGEYNVVAQGSGFCDGSRQRIHVAGNRIYPVHFVLYRGGTFTVIVVADGMAVTGASVQTMNQSGQQVYGTNPMLPQGAGGGKAGGLSGGDQVSTGADGSESVGTSTGLYTGMPTGENGRFDSGILCPGSYTVTVAREGYHQVQQVIRVEDERHTNETIVLRRIR